MLPWPAKTFVKSLLTLQVAPEVSFQLYKRSQHLYSMHEWSQIRDSLHSSSL